jgi:hypothetical protein
LFSGTNPNTRSAAGCRVRGTRSLATRATYQRLRDETWAHVGEHVFVTVWAVGQARSAIRRSPLDTRAGQLLARFCFLWICISYQRTCNHVDERHGPSFGPRHRNRLVIELGAHRCNITHILSTRERV